MKLAKLQTMLVLGSILLSAGLALGQAGPELTSPRDAWQRKALRTQTGQAAVAPTGPRVAPAWTPSRNGQGYTRLAAAETIARPAPEPKPASPAVASPTVSAASPAASPAGPALVAPRSAGSPIGPPIAAAPGPMLSPGVVPEGDIQYAPMGPAGGPFGDEAGPDAGTCSQCGHEMYPEGDFCPDCGCPGAHCGECMRWSMRHFSFFAGVQGFKGPMDLGRNGNFGFHEGFNFGAPLGDPLGFGYQLGMQAVQSNFSGNQVVNGGGLDNGRDQVFATAGVFKRELCGGLQGGVAFDYQHDSYYASADMRQLRTETSFNFDGCQEVGFFGAFDIGGDRIFILPAARGLITPVQANDVYSVFYRRYFSGGGVGRVWSGVSGQGEVLVGAEATVPLGTNWSLENSFVYLAPDQGGATGQTNESWSVNFSLVFYPGRESRCVYRNPYTPLFGVADNSSFLVRRGTNETAQ